MKKIFFSFGLVLGTLLSIGQTTDETTSNYKASDEYGWILQQLNNIYPPIKQLMILLYVRKNIRLKSLVLITLFYCSISAISQTEKDSLGSVKTNADSIQISK